MTISTAPRLTGDALLSLVDSMKDAAKSDIVRAANYTETKENGTERLCFTDFYEALIEAKGGPAAYKGGGPIATPAAPASTETGTKKFTINYPMTVYVVVEVERPANITEEDLLASITKDDLANAPVNDSNSWDSLKEEWRSAGAGELYIHDEEYNDIY